MLKTTDVMPTSGRFIAVTQIGNSPVCEGLYEWDGDKGKLNKYFEQSGDWNRVGTRFNSRTLFIFVGE